MAGAEVFGCLAQVSRFLGGRRRSLPLLIASLPIPLGPSSLASRLLGPSLFCGHDKWTDAVRSRYIHIGLILVGKGLLIQAMWKNKW